MWHKAKLGISITGSGTAPVCSVLAAHPWVFGLGREEDSGFYLSPPNAVSWLRKQLAGAPVRQDVTAIMLTAPTLAAFITQLAAAVAVFPLPVLTQVWRRAKTAETLAVTRMQLPAAAGNLPGAFPLSVSTLRSASAASAIISSISGGMPATTDGLAIELAEFTTQRAALLSAAETELAQLTAGAVDVWTVSALQNTTDAVRQMLENIPDPDHVFALAMLFAGDDLASLRAMLRTI